MGCWLLTRAGAARSYPPPRPGAAQAAARRARPGLVDATRGGAEAEGVRGGRPEVRLLRLAASLDRGAPRGRDDRAHPRAPAVWDVYFWGLWHATTYPGGPEGPQWGEGPHITYYPPGSGPTPGGRSSIQRYQNRRTCAVWHRCSRLRRALHPLGHPVLHSRGHPPLRGLPAPMISSLRFTRCLSARLTCSCTSPGKEKKR
jgi:hypothetical protein